VIGITVIGNSGAKYTTLSAIGSSSGFGAVFLAQDEGGHEFALKLIAPAADPEAVASFRQEIESTSGLDLHQNILRVIDWGSTTIKGQPGLFIISELCKDGDYRSVVDSYVGKGFQLEAILADFRQILSGLEVLHSKIIHRDLKPENVLRAGSVLKIGDYGLAKFVNEATRALTFKGKGTFTYMAPEVWLTGSATAATDLYAVGIMLFEALTGRVPYTADDLFRLKEEHLYAQIPRPRSINSDVPDYLDGMVKKLLAKAPKDRYQSAREVLDALSKLGRSSATDAACEIADRARRHHDQAEARKLEQLKLQKAAEEEIKRNLFARHELVSLFDNAVAEINSQLPETKIKPIDSFTAGRAYEFGARILIIWFFDRHEIFRDLDLGLVAILRAKNPADAGYIKITENGEDREAWNIVQLRPANTAYGEWKLLKTHDLSSVRTQARKRFATDAALFGKNLAYHWQPAVHTYMLSEKALEANDVYQILGVLVPNF